MSSYSSSIVTGRNFEIQRDIGLKRQFYLSLIFNLHDLLEPFEFSPEKFNILGSVHQRNRQTTDGRLMP